MRAGWLAMVVVLVAGCRAVPTAADFDFPDADGSGADATDGADGDPPDDAVDVADSAGGPDAAEVEVAPDAADAADVADSPDDAAFEVAPDAGDVEDAPDLEDSAAVADVADVVDDVTVATDTVDAADAPDIADVIDAVDVAVDTPPPDVSPVEDIADVVDAVVDAQQDVVPDVAVDPCAGKNCDDGNACTIDSCSAGVCQWTQLPDWSPCGVGMVCDGQGMCADVKIAKGMAYIPTGTFWMGCNAAKDVNCNANASEKPQHKVTLSAYYMDLTETTVAQYKACVEAGVCTVPASIEPTQYATYPGKLDHPVNFVSWAQSQKYCKWRGPDFDLPTEAQWEMAARGSCEKNGSTADAPTCAAAMRTYPWGEPTATCNYAVMANGFVACGNNDTMAVGSKPAGDSPYGLHDMAGNLSEWARDDYDANFYSSSPSVNPVNDTGVKPRVFRGGYYYSGAQGLRGSIRYTIAADTPWDSVGLRCIRVVSPADLCASVTCPAIACATNTCDATTGQCVATKLSDGAACEDGSACTSNDQCVGGTCFSGGATNCDDGNSCTKDACAPVAGCSHVGSDSNTCSDGSLCTADSCVAGVCQGVAVDADNDGYGPGAACGGDCNDGNAAIHPGAAEVCNGVDDNCDGLTDEPGATNCTNFYKDADSDGYGAGTPACRCAPSATYTTSKGNDCNDNDPKINPAMTEVCNGIDDDCDGVTDNPNALGCTTFYADLDKDGFGNSSQSVCICAATGIYTATIGGDCDDSKAKVNPVAVEVCDGLDNDCNGIVDDSGAQGCAMAYKDADGDGYGSSASKACVCGLLAPYTTWTGGDCNDTSAAIHPGAAEVCNGIDDNCNGTIDEGGGGPWYRDVDGDGYGDPGSTAQGCAEPSGYVANATDCDDTHVSVHPGAPEICDGLDNNCNGQTDEGLTVTTYYQDVDGDGYGGGAGKSQCGPMNGFTVTLGGDCNDNVKAINPAVSEVCGNSLDDNCNGQTDEGCSSTPAGMVLIPAGTFWMGCNATKDANCSGSEENPQHKVTLSAYYMDLTETTVMQYKACVDASVCTAPSTQSPSAYATYPGFPNNPVNYVNWTQSQQYCQWRGAGFDLPTEAQWEMAAKGNCEKNGSTAGDAGCAAAMRTYPWGEPTATCSYAVMYDGTNSGCGTNATWAVGSKTAGDSPYGLHDMAGNVHEWTRDWYSSTYYSSSPATDPYDSASASGRVGRGGGFVSGAVYLRAGYRGNGAPSDASKYIGLRCMRSYP